MIMKQQRERRQDGFTLVEMLVVLGLVTVIATISSTIMIATLRTTRQQQARNGADAQLRTALERVSRTLREAEPRARDLYLSSRDPRYVAAQNLAISRNSVTVSTDLLVGCTTTTYTRDNAGTLTASVGPCGGVAGTSVLATGLSTAAPLFDTFPAGATTPSVPPSCSTACSVRVSLTAPQSEGRAATGLTSTVQLRNSGP